jgi:hypothetical protein
MSEQVDLVGFAEDFLEVDREHLPSNDDALRRALIADAIRMAISNAPTSENGWSRIHTNSLRHWVERKLEAVLIATGLEEEASDELVEDWFQAVLRESRGPNLKFLGEVLELEQGYYAPAPTRAVLGADSGAVLISGRPTSDFTETGLDIRIAGMTRHIRDVSRDELEELGIDVQSMQSYAGVEEGFTYDRDYLTEFIESNETVPWDPHEEWDGYLSRTSTFHFRFGEDYREVLTNEGQVSLWKSEEEFYQTEYWLRINPVDNDAEMRMVKVPNRLFRYFCLIIDSIPGQERTVRFEPANGQIRVRTGFIPPAAHCRWLNATGADYEGYDDDKDEISWLIDPDYADSTAEIFQSLSINVDRASR